MRIKLSNRLINCRDNDDNLPLFNGQLWYETLNTDPTNVIHGNNTSNPITYNFSYTKSGLVSSVTINPGANQKQVTFNYDENNNLVSKVNPNNTQDNFTYNEANQITGTQTVDNNNNPKWSNQYAYDADGRITSVSGTDPGTSNYAANYTYNAGTEKLNRLTQAVITDGTYSGTFNYSYDPAGNPLTMDVANGTSTPNHQTFTYDTDNRITSPGFGYDTNGNLTSAVINGVSYQYVYDAANRLKTVKNGSGGNIATYTYDGNGKRLTKTVYGTPTVTTTYHYFQGQLWYETLNTDLPNVIHALYLRSSNGALQGVSLNYNVGSTSNTWYYYHYNAHGDVIAVTDGSGNVYRQYVYDPYGNIINVKDGSGTPVNINNDSGFNNAYTYAGYRYDSENGLYFLNARYYAAGFGRFLTKDSELGHKSIPQTLNRYAYAGGNPVNYIDPSGHFFFLIPLLGEEAVAALIVLTGELVAAIGEAAPAVVENGEGDVNAVESVVSDVASEGAAVADGAGAASEASSTSTNFIVTPKGENVSIPNGATGPIPVVNKSGNVTGYSYTGGNGGANGQVSTVRIMKPTPGRGNSPGYPNGYIKYENSLQQGVDSVSGKTIPNTQSHIPFLFNWWN